MVLADKMEKENTELTISKSKLDMLFWMLEDSHSSSLQSQSVRVLLTHFESLEAARKFRSEQEAQQFLLSHIFARHPKVHTV